MTQQQINQKMQALMNDEAAGAITEAEFEAGLDEIRKALREEDTTERAMSLIAKELGA